MNRIRKGTVESIPLEKPYGAIYRIANGDNGDVWLGTYGGLCRVADGRVRCYTSKDGLSNNIVYALHRHRHGTLWIGTRGGGLSRWRSGALATQFVNGLADAIIYDIHEDPDGVLWLN